MERRGINDIGLLLGVSEEGATFRSYRDGTKMTLTPESSVAAQKAIGADIIIPLDELPPYDVSGEGCGTASSGRIDGWRGVCASI